MEWILEIITVYNIQCGAKIQREYLYGFTSEKACVQHQALEDKHLKRIKHKTNVAEVQYVCFTR